MCRVFKKAGHAIGDFWQWVILTKSIFSGILSVAMRRKAHTDLARTVGRDWMPSPDWLWKQSCEGFYPCRGRKRRKEKRMKKAKYDKTLPRRMYLYFRTYDEKCGAPSFVKFAMANGYTLEDLLSFRKHRAFELSYREASEIRRDYLIDHALCRQFDRQVFAQRGGTRGRRRRRWRTGCATHCRGRLRNAFGFLGLMAGILPSSPLTDCPV